MNDPESDVRNLSVKRLGFEDGKQVTVSAKTNAVQIVRQILDKNGESVDTHHAVLPHPMLDLLFERLTRIGFWKAKHYAPKGLYADYDNYELDARDHDRRNLVLHISFPDKSAPNDIRKIVKLSHQLLYSPIALLRWRAYLHRLAPRGKR